MTMNQPATAEEAARLRGRLLALAETDMTEAVSSAVRQFLSRMQKEIRSGLTAAMTASPSTPFVTSELFTTGQLAGWWETAVDANVAPAVERAWRLGHYDISDTPLSVSSLQHAGEYLANVTDRLSRTATPTIPDQAFDRVRVSLAEEIGRGSTIDDMTRRLGAELDWHGGPVSLWEERRDELSGQLDALLDEHGPARYLDPSDPDRMIVNQARQDALDTDPRVRELQARRTEYVKRIDEDRSTWETRSERIARTETTGAYNAGGLDAAHEENQSVKMWVASADARTRDSHLEASGDCVGIDDLFELEGGPVAMPGDPSGPPEETINCRCTLLYYGSCEEAAGKTGKVSRIIDEEREKRRQDVGDLDPTEVPLATFGVGDQELIDTRSLFGDTADGQFAYNPDRVEQVHDRYIADQLAKGTRVDEPSTTFMGGGPASGKSSVIDSGDVNLPKGHVVVDPDEAKKAIPEYRAGTRAGDQRAASFAHEESSDMAKRLMRESLDSGHHTVVDGTGDGSYDGLARKISAAREHGATRIVGEYVTVDTDEAVRRAMARAAETGRMVPETVIRGTHRAVSEVFPQAARAGLFDELRLYDTNAGAPRLIFEKVGGVERIVDPAAWQSFLAKANP